MKYMLSWHERPQGSAIEYENVQRRILAVFEKWSFPETLTIHQFLVRLGEWGGFLLVETDDPLAIQKLTTAFAVFEWRVVPVLGVEEAVGAELEAMAWRDSIGVTGSGG